ncbi:MAG: rhomboid family intramembrane serine protease [Solirubrobacteraceae bacterium]|nr:rhomboid family intramembrane serine protease [Solirubrobacteraceae bacterium]
MSTTSRFQRPELSDDRRRGLVFIAITTLIMWVSEIIDSIKGVDLDQYGVRPRHLDGLDGILWQPFLHGGFDHLIGNTVPYVVLGGMIALSGFVRVVSVFVIVALIGGIGTWIIAPENTIHIGASGVVFGFAAYLVARWIYTRSLTHVFAGVLVCAVWGGALLGGLVPTDGISWQGHLFGGLGGLFAAFLLDGRDRRKVRSGRGRAFA